MPYTIEISIYILIQILNSQPILFHIFTLFFCSIPLIVALILFCRVRHFDDLFGIKDEIKYQCIIIFIMLTIYLSLFLTFEYLPSTPNLIRIEWITYILFINFLFFGLAILSTAFPVYLNLYGVADPNDPTGIKRLKLHHKSPTMRVIYHKGHFKQISSSTSKSSKSSAKIRDLLECISLEQSFTKFMQHLVMFHITH